MSESVPFRPEHLSERAATVVSDRVQPGDLVECRDASDKWFPRLARTAILNGYKFPVVFVSRTADSEPVAWPADDVRLVEQPA
jgi:hypothetical protein